MAPDAAGDRLTLESLGFGEPTLPGRANGQWWKKAVFWALLPVLGLVVCAGAGVLGHALLFPHMQNNSAEPTRVTGNCFLFDPSWCISLDQESVEHLAGMPLPPGAEIVDSGASRGFKSGSEHALVRWPAGTPMPTPPAGVIIAEHDGLDGSFSRIDAVWVGAGYQSWVTKLGLGPNGEPQLSVTRLWDG